MATITATGSRNHHNFALNVWENSTSVANNTSNVGFSFVISPKTSGYKWSGWNTKITFTVNIEGRTFTGSIPSYDGSSSVTLSSSSFDIEHGNDGKKTIGFSFSVSDTTGATYTCGNASSNGYMDLTTIPRASSIYVADGYINENTTYYIDRKSNNFTHTLKYTFGSVSGTIATKTTSTSATWKIPSSFYAQIPNDKKGTCTITCETYNGNTKIGDTQSCTFTAYCNETTCKPTITGTAVDTNSTTTALTGNNKKFIEGYSNVKVTPSVTLKNSAGSISKITLNGTTITGETTLNKITTSTLKLQATDSRGFPSDEYTIPNLSLVSYIPLTISPTAKRTNQTSSEVKVSYSGKYFNSSFGSVSNTLSVKTYYKLSTASSWTEFSTTPTKSGNNYSYNLTAVGVSMPYTNAYDFKFEAKDKLVTSTTTIKVTKGVPNIAFHKGAILLNGTNIFLKAYPVGSIYISYKATSPASLFGGTWTQITGRFIYATTATSGDKGNVGNSTGTSTNSTTLTTSQIPSHTHSIRVGWSDTAKSNSIVPTWGTASLVIDNAAANKTGATGGGTGHTHAIPYLEVYVWKRTA